MDTVDKSTRSKIMASVKGKNTSLEKIVFSALRKRKLYFQKHYKKAPGSPDIALPRKKIAIFIDGDFWHGYRYSVWQRKITDPFWRNKIEANIARDRKNFAKLRRKGWKVLRVWEHQIKKNREATIENIIEFLIT